MKISYAVFCQHINIITMGEPKVICFWKRAGWSLRSSNISNYRHNVLGSAHFSAVQYNYVTFSTVHYT